MKSLKENLRQIVHKLRDIRAGHFLKKKIKYKNLIEVVFICQCQHIWDKQKSVAKMLSSIEKYHVTLLIVPEENGVDDTIFERYAISNGIDYIKYEYNILKTIKPQLIFYPRPYDSYLPNDLKTKNTYKKAKCIYIPYGYSFMKLGDVNLSLAFTRQISLFIADTTYAYDYFNKSCSYNLKKGYQTSVNIGFSYMEDLYVNHSEYLNSRNMFDSIKNSGYKVIWTPRWVIDDTMGGSNFFRYIDDIFNMFINNEDYSFIFRPHPYAFSNFVNIKLMTQAEVDNYLNRISNSSNSFYDNSSEYLSTFENSDALITDVSSIIAEYMVTKKPIIFCHNESSEVLNDFTLKCCDMAFYNAYSFDDIKRIITDLKQGIDPLKESRERFIDNFINTFVGTNDRIRVLLDNKERDWFKNE